MPKLKAIFKERVGKWKSPYCLVGENAARATAPGSEWRKPLRDLVVGFIQDVVGVKPDHPQARHPAHLFEMVTAWRPPRGNARVELTVGSVWSSQSHVQSVTCWKWSPHS